MGTALTGNGLNGPSLTGTLLVHIGREKLSSSQRNFCLIVKNSHKSRLTELKRSSTETRGGHVLGCSSWRALVKLLSLITGEVKTTVTLASLDEAKLLAPPQVRA